MTKRLEEAFKRISALPDTEQDFYAAMLLGELEDAPVPDWHLEILKEREAELANNPEDGIPWEQVREELRQRTRR